MPESLVRPPLVGLLPPVSLTGRDGVETLRPARSRALLAVLALQPSHTVTQTKLAHILWDEPPATARANIRTLIARVRSAAQAAGLGNEVRIVTHHAAWGGEGGYSLEVDPSHVDILALERHLRTVRGRASEDPVAAFAGCRELLALDLEGFGVDFPATHWFSGVKTSLANTRRSLRRLSVALHIVIGSYQEAHAEARAGTGEDSQLAELAIAASFLAGDRFGALDGVQRLLHRYRDYGVDLPSSVQRLQSAILEGDAPGVVAVVRESVTRL